MSSSISYRPLNQRLVAPEGDLNATNATPMLEVVAPATLPEGYQFDVMIGSRTMSVMVPPGGVEEGQKFQIPWVDEVSSPSISVPVGHWKDDICDCCIYGPFHNHWLMSLLCPLLAAGQVISRLKYTPFGTPGSVAESSGACQKLAYFTAVLTFIIISLYFSILSYADQGGSMDPPPPMIFMLIMIRDSLHYIFLAILIYVLWNLRYHIRVKYAIPERESCPTGCEDLLCAVFCSHCAVAQMMRHTTNYDIYNGNCCSETGLPPHVPAIV